jgi:hypothetical protein
MQNSKSQVTAFGKLIDQVKQIMANSIHDVFIICIVIAAISLFSIFFIKEIPLSQISSTNENID